MKSLKKHVFSISLLIAVFLILSIVLIEISRATYQLEFKRFQSKANTIAAKELYRQPIDTKSIRKLADSLINCNTSSIEFQAIELKKTFKNFDPIKKILVKSFHEHAITTPVDAGFYIKYFSIYDSSSNIISLIPKEEPLLLFGDSVDYSKHSQDFTFYHKGDTYFFEILLKVEYPTLSKYIIKKSSRTIIISSIVLMIVFSIVFYTIKTIIKQKKLAEMKSDFINHITHDLNTPLSVIQLATDSLKKNDCIKSDNENLYMLQTIQKQNKNLQQMLTNVIDLNFLNKTNLIPSPVEINLSCIDEIAMQLQTKYPDKEVKIETEYNDTRYVYFDEYYFHILMNNLIENAIKFNPSSTIINITLNTSAIDHTLKINDNGIGMAKKHAKKIFQKNYQIKAHESKGLGFGLYYVKLIVEAHKGKIFVESILNQGTTVTVKIPRHENQ